MSSFIDKLKKLSKVQNNFINRSAVIAVNFSKERFIQKNWVDKSRQPWEARKRDDRGSLMVRTGRLKRSIRKIKVGTNFFIIGTDVPYAQIHNDGGTIKKTVTVKAHNRKNTRGRETSEAKVQSHNRKINMTFKKRQFIGESAVLMRRIERQLETDIKEAIQ